MLFYFTATGNCLYVAKQLEDNLYSIPQVIHQENLTFKDEAIGVVFPVYAGEPPKIVKEFLQKATFETPYFYLILTYGKDDSDAPEFASHLCEEYGIHVDYANSILMVDNYLPSFDMNEERAIDKHIPEQIEKIAADVKERKHFILEASQDARDFHQRTSETFAQNPELINGYQITVTDRCIGCGICTRVCPVGRFYIEDGKAKRTMNTCEFCLACAQNCPQKAIITSIRDKNPDARYRNENISLQEIIKANQQH